MSVINIGALALEKVAQLPKLRVIASHIIRWPHYSWEGSQCLACPDIGRACGDAACLLLGPAGDTPPAGLFLGAAAA